MIILSAKSSFLEAHMATLLTDLRNFRVVLIFKQCGSKFHDVLYVNIEVTVDHLEKAKTINS